MPSLDSEHARVGDYLATGHDEYNTIDYTRDDYIQWAMEHARNVTIRKNKKKRKAKRNR